MAHSSLTDKQQRQILAVLRMTGRVMCAIGIATIALALLISLAHGLTFSVANEANPNPGDASSSPLGDAIGTWGFGIATVGILTLTLARWFRNLFEPRCLTCKTRIQIGAHFCTTCGHDVSTL